MFALRFTNIPDAGTRHFDTVAEAVAFGQKSGFQFEVAPVLSKSQVKRLRVQRRDPVWGGAL